MDPAKRDRLDAYLSANDLESVWFARPNSFAWLTGGDNAIDRDSALGVAAAGYDGKGIQVVTANNEAQRLREEELSEDVAVRTYPWYADSLADALAERAAVPSAADFDIPGFQRVDASSLRQPLTATDVEHYRSLGTDTAAAVEAVARDVAADHTERRVAADLRRELADHGIDAPVVLVGGSGRAQEFRHFTPQDEPLGEYALLSVTAQRGGLYASCTRTVAFEAPSWLSGRHEAAAQVEVSALVATQAVADSGGSAGAVFDAVVDAYEGVGYPHEWELHHQGGAAGYAGREWIATPDHGAAVTTPMAYAWNPTIQGAKSEDTVLVTPNGFEILTATGDWPTAAVEAVDRDRSLDRHAVLER